MRACARSTAVVSGCGTPSAIPRHILASIYILRDTEYLPERASQSQGRSTRRALFHGDGFHRGDRTPQSMGLDVGCPGSAPACRCLTRLVSAGGCLSLPKSDANVSEGRGGRWDQPRGCG